MAKTAKVKKREVSFHSRAARRAASPSIDLDKSLKPSTKTRDSASPSRPSQTQHHALAAQNAGIQKKSKKGNMTRAQRLRHQKGLEKAAEVLDKRQVKVVKSLGKERNIKERSKGWDDVNGEGGKKSKKAKAANAFDALDEDEVEEKKEREWVSDEEMDGAENPVEGEVKGDGKPLDAAVAQVEDDELL